jgi:hypothetical protein
MVGVIIDQAKDHREQIRDAKAIEGIMIHRVGVDLRQNLVIGYDALTICDAFLGRNERWAAVAKVTGRQNAYTFYVGGGLGPEQYDGHVWQALPLDEVGHHGLRFSHSHIGVALIGDFRVRPPTERQFLAAIDLCADLCLLIGLASRRIVGHGEVEHAHSGSKAPGKPGACPGDFLVMRAFRDAVHSQMLGKIRQDARWRLEQANVRLP